MTKPTPSPKGLAAAAKKLKELGTSAIMQRTGPLTRELLLSPGVFGLAKVPERIKADQTTTMVCGFCSTGCGLSIHLKEGTAVNLSPTTEYPVNLGMACPKGWEALTPLYAPDRATTPMLRNASGKLVPTTWPVALETFVSKFKGIQEKHGKDAIAFLGTGQIPSEELAFLGSLAKFGMGVIDGDGNTRQCMATAVVAYKQAFGFDAPPYSYQDFEESDTIILVGANLCIAHPIMWERVCRNPHKPEIVVIDPRKTETAMAATQHVPLAPKSDLTLFYGIANLLIERGAIDKNFIENHTKDFEDYRTHVKKYDRERVIRETGLSGEAIDRLVDTIARGKRVSFWWTMGINQSHEGVRTAQSLINLALITGNIGRPGTGANSITGQCNAMGSRLFANTTNLLGGHDFTNAEHRDKVAGALGIDVQAIPDKGSATYDQILEKILKGKIRGLWVVATNPAHSWINQDFLKDVASRLDFLVVQDMYHSTETARLAHLLLPSAGWGEKEGTFINSERRIGVLKKVSRAPGQALADFQIFRLIADAWGCGEMFKDWTSPEAVFELLKKVSKGQPCDISGLGDYAMLDRHGGVQWPYPEAAKVAPPEQQRRLFADGRFFHADGKAKFCFEDSRPMPEPTDSKYPHLLLTGRGSSSQWHTQTRTGKSAVLRKLYPNDIYVEISPNDARDLKVEPNEWVNIHSRRATVKARAFVTHTVQPGQVFVPMHYSEMNRLTFPSFDPYSRQPSYKACAVRIAPVRNYEE